MGIARAGRTASWGLLAVVLVAALLVGGRDGSPPTDADRVQRITEKIRCPTCRSQSVADSDAPAADAIREETRRRVAEGQTDEQILDYLVGRYQDDILLEPPRRGVGAAVWVLPVLAVAATLAGLAAAFRRWKPKGRSVSDEDRALVERAMHEPG
jgi:cytochrome c-type biogenesis protein CcmH